MTECLLGAIGLLARSSWPLVWVIFLFFRLIRDRHGTAAQRLADGDEQPPGALERTSSCTATRTGWRDWALLGVAVAASLIEAALRPDRTWLLTALAVSIVVALCVLWRPIHPLAASRSH